jgi:hypothetical protein
MSVNKDDGFNIIHKDIFILQYNESAKVIDFCKNQQWYVVGLGVGINYGMIVICQEYLKLIPSFQFLVLLILIFVSFAIPIIGKTILDDLNNNTIKHRQNIDILKNEKYIEVPDELRGIFFKNNPEVNQRDSLFINIFKTSLLLSSLISSIVLLNSFYILIG